MLITVYKDMTMNNSTFSLISIGLTSALLLSGCASDPKEETTQLMTCDVPNAPEWVCNQAMNVTEATHFELAVIEYDDSLPYSIQEDRLMERGRSMIATSLSSEIKRNSYSREEVIGDSLGSEYRVFSKVVDTQASEVKLLKTRLYRRVVHSDGMFYGLVGIPNVEYERAYKTVVKSINKDNFAKMVRVME